SGDSRGFGFLTLERDEDADAAIRALDQTEWNGRVVLHPSGVVAACSLTLILLLDKGLVIERIRAAAFTKGNNRITYIRDGKGDYCSYLFDEAYGLASEKLTGSKSNLKINAGDKLATAKETGRWHGIGTNMYPSSALLGEHNGEFTSVMKVDELIYGLESSWGVARSRTKI
ncbi:hypothetical protein IFM89_006444, partial [Coptis chinensis]